MRERRLRRMAGLFCARLPELDLDAVADPRARAGRWSLAQILRATLVGLMAGCRSLWEAEQLMDWLSPAMRRVLGLPRRLADTTARDALCRVRFDELRAALHRLVRAAWRRKALAPVGLPVSVVALDGKVTALPTLNHPLVQNHVPEVGLPYGLVRTVTCALVSAAGRPCIDAIPIPGETNEMGHFQTAFASLVETHGGLFEVDDLVRRFRNDTEPTNDDRNRVRAHRYEEASQEAAKYFQSLDQVKDQIQVFEQYFNDLFLVLAKGTYSMTPLVRANAEGTARDLADLILLGSINRAVIRYGLVPEKAPPDDPPPWYWRRRKEFYERGGTLADEDAARAPTARR